MTISGFNPVGIIVFKSKPGKSPSMIVVVRGLKGIPASIEDEFMEFELFNAHSLI